jgi:hypothetical protein
MNAIVPLFAQLDMVPWRLSRARKMLQRDFTEKTV